MDGKEQNGLKVSAHVLRDASAAVKQHIVRVVRQRRGDAARPIPTSILYSIVSS